MNTILSQLLKFYNNEYQDIITSTLIPTKTGIRKPRFSTVKVAYILILYHHSHYKNFKYFYLEHIYKRYKRELGKLPSYSWILRLKNRCFHFLSCFLQSNFNKTHDICIVDSTPISVCHNLRIHSNKVFEASAVRSKSSMGWFYGFKVHALINHNGKIVRIFLSQANLDDRKGLKAMIKGFTGTIIGDKGYLSKKLKAELQQKGINLITNYKENMKNKPKHSEFEFKLLQKRKSVETFFNLLKDKYNLKNLKVRSPISLFVAIISACCAYIVTKQKVNTNIHLRE